MTRHAALSGWPFRAGDSLVATVVREIQMESTATPQRVPTLAEIMQQRGVGKKAAYAYLRKATREMYEGVEVPTNWREQALLALYNDRHVRDTNQLLQHLHAIGINSNGHDATKVVWSLQKSGLVRFRERAGGTKGLYAISLTPAGEAAGQRLARNGATPPEREKVEVSERLMAFAAPVEPPLTEEEQANVTRLTALAESTPEEPEEEVVAIVDEPAATAALLEAAVPPSDPGRWVTTIRPWPHGNFDDYPVIGALRTRAIRSRKLTLAIRLLEEAGEEDTALAIMAKNDFSPLEQEVIRLLNHFGDIPEEPA